MLQPVIEGLLEDVSNLAPGKPETAKFNKEFILFGRDITRNLKIRSRTNLVAI
jgi:hypothetical protein